MMIKNINTGPFTVSSGTSGTVHSAVVEALETTAVEIIEALSMVSSGTSGTVHSAVVEALETTAIIETTAIPKTTATKNHNTHN